MRHFLFLDRDKVAVEDDELVATADGSQIRSSDFGNPSVPNPSLPTSKEKPINLRTLLVSGEGRGRCTTCWRRLLRGRSILTMAAMNLLAPQAIAFLAGSRILSAV